MESIGHLSAIDARETPLSVVCDGDFLLRLIVVVVEVVMHYHF